MAASTPRPESPCNGVCELESQGGFCRGCGRTIKEISQWAILSPQKKQQILDEIDLRKESKK